MDTLLLISKEPALGEAVAAELPDMQIEQTGPDTAAAMLAQDRFRLILADEDGSDMRVLLEGALAPVVRLSRPVRLSDLLYTIRGQLQGKTAALRETPLSADVALLPAERTLRTKKEGLRITLTEKETELLLCLLEKPGKSVGREALLKRVWGYSDDVATRTIETHIYRLRGKLRQADERFDIVFSEEGGYTLNCG